MGPIIPPFECCASCLHHRRIDADVVGSFVRDYYYCRYKSQDDEIRHPFFMGGSRKCTCYCKIKKPEKEKFEYPVLHWDGYYEDMAVGVEKVIPDNPKSAEELKAKLESMEDI